MPKNTKKTCDLCGEPIRGGEAYYERSAGNHFHKFCPLTANTPDSRPFTPTWWRTTYDHVLAAGRQEKARYAGQDDHWRGFERGVIALGTAMGIVRDAEAEMALLELLREARAEKGMLK